MKQILALALFALVFFGCTGLENQEVCGDGICSSSENYAQCPSDCPNKLILNAIPNSPGRIEIYVKTYDGKTYAFSNSVPFEVKDLPPSSYTINASYFANQNEVSNQFVENYALVWEGGDQKITLNLPNPGINYQK